MNSGAPFELILGDVHDGVPFPVVLDIADLNGFGVDDDIALADAEKTADRDDVAAQVALRDDQVLDFADRLVGRVDVETNEIGTQHVVGLAVTKTSVVVVTAC